MSITSKYHNYQMSFLYNTNEVLSKKKEKILFWIPGGMPSMLNVEGAIAAALKLRGHDIHIVICNGTYRGCILRDAGDATSVEEWGNKCKACVSQTTFTLESFGLPFSYIGGYLSNKIKQELWNLATSVYWADLTGFKYKKLEIGKNIKSSIYRFLKGREFDGKNEIVWEYTYSALVNAEASFNVVDKFKPSKIFMSHGIYVDWGPTLLVAFQKHIPVSAWMASYMPARFYFTHIEDKKKIDFHFMSKTGWEEQKNNDFSENKKRTLFEYMRKRYTKNTSFDMKRFYQYKEDKYYFRKKFNLDNRPVWGILTHINWDAVGESAPMVYITFDEWIENTIETISRIKEVQWLIKIHPAELQDNPDTGVQRLIKDKYPKLPHHIRVIPGDEKINPLDFYNLLDGAVTIFGTPGLELSALGKPVILAGEAHYANKGFTYDSNKKSDYIRNLKTAISIPKLRKSQQLIAQKYAYCYFLKRQIPFPPVKDPNSRWWRFQFDKRKLLVIGKDPFVDLICNRIIDGKDFIMEDHLVKISENY